jgi:hypothetical protein
VSAELARQARRLAKRLGCEVQVWGKRGRTYWVFGPPGVYPRCGHEQTAYSGAVPAGGFRRDPCAGEHCHADWDEALAALRIYQWDLWFHARGITTSDAEKVCASLYGEGREIFRQAVEDGDDAVVGIVADWIEEHGEQERAAILRK